MTLPLEGMTVVAIEQAVAAPLATRNLSDLGARVIKVERIDGGDLARGYDHVVHGTGAHFVWLNRGKESLAVDLKCEQGRRIVPRPQQHTLIRRSLLPQPIDVFKLAVRLHKLVSGEW